MFNICIFTLHTLEIAIFVMQAVYCCTVMCTVQYSLCCHTLSSHPLGEILLSLASHLWPIWAEISVQAGWDLALVLHWRPGHHWRHTVAGGVALWSVGATGSRILFWCPHITALLSPSVLSYQMRIRNSSVPLHQQHLHPTNFYLKIKENSF